MITAAELATIRYHLAKGVSERVVARWFGVRLNEMKAALAAAEAPQQGALAAAEAPVANAVANEEAPLGAPAASEEGQPQAETAAATCEATGQPRPDGQGSDDVPPLREAGEGAPTPAPANVPGQSDRPIAATQEACSWPPSREELHALFVGQALSYAAIGELFGVTKNVVAGMCFRLGVKRTSAPYKPRQRKHDRNPQDPVGCRWIDGDVRAGGWRYCQGEIVPGSSYCQHHHHRSVQRGSAINALKRDIARQALYVAGRAA